MLNEERKNTAKVKQLGVLKRLLENTGGKGGKRVTFGEAGTAEGYSKKYVDSGALQRTETWQKLLDEFLPDNLVAKRHKELLNKQEILIRNNNETKELEKVSTGQPHSDVRAALDMAYKLKRRYDNTINVTGEIGRLSDAEIEDRIAGVLSGVIGAIQGEGTKTEE